MRNKQMVALQHSSASLDRLVPFIGGLAVMATLLLIFFGRW